MQTHLSIPVSFKRSILFCLICVIVNFIFGQTLDKSFGINGRVVDPSYSIPSDGGLSINSAVFEGDKILIGGDIAYENQFYIFLRRFNSNGEPDESFVWTLTFRVGGGAGGYLARQPDGKFLLAATSDLFDYFSETQKIALCRFKPNGALDNQFGKGGIFNKSVGGYSETTNAIAIRPGGKILLCGYITTKKSNISLIQFFNNGTIDTSFGASGIIYPTTPYEGVGRAIKMLPENKILVAFSYRVDNPFGYRNCLIRYTREGKIDSSFGKNGIVLNNNGNDNGGNGLVIQPDGKILEYVNYKDQRMLLRYTSDGKPDNSFGNKGRVQLPFQSGSDLSIALQENGKILVNANPGFAIARYTANGAPDLSFGKNGILSTSFEYPAAGCQKVILQPDGKIIAIGNVVDEFEEGIYLAMARFNNTKNDIVKSGDLIAVNQSHSVLLKWQTGAQSDATHFSVERSADNVNFKEIGTVLSKSQVSSDLRYSFEDVSPLTGNSYYRLKQFQTDGSFYYSKLVPINFSKSPQITLAPNPVKNILQVNGLNATAKNNMSILRASGKTIKLSTVSQSNYSWDIHDLQAGTYYLVITTNGATTSLKFIKD